MRRWYNSLHPFTKTLITTACIMLIIKVATDWWFYTNYGLHESLWEIITESAIDFALILFVTFVNYAVKRFLEGYYEDNNR